MNHTLNTLQFLIYWQSMRHRTKTLVEGKYHSLVRSVHPKTKRASFTLRFSPSLSGMSQADQTELRDHFDPGRNRGSATGWTWRYKSRAEAEQLLAIAILKWG